MQKIRFSGLFWSYKWQNHVKTRLIGQIWMASTKKTRENSMFRSTVTPRSRILCPFSQKITQSLEPYVRFFSARAIHSSFYVKMAPECSAIKKFEPFAQKANWRGAQNLEPYVQKVCWALWGAPVWQAALLVWTLCSKWKKERPKSEPFALIRGAA